MRTIIAAGRLTPLALAIAAPAFADTSVSSKITTNLATSSAGNVTVTSDGTIAPTSGTAVTIDSSGATVSNAGAISFSDVSDTTGIAASGGLAGTITNSGSITLTETATATDSDSDGDVDGALANGTNRIGILVGGGGTFTGDIVNSGTITVTGNASAGMNAIAALAGNLTQSGTISVIGDNSFGIRLGEVAGNVALNGSTSVQGANSVGVAIIGPINGALSVQGSILATGYRSTSVSTTDALAALDADDLLQGGPALSVAASIGGGILIDAPPADDSTTDDDEDDDGVTDSSEGTGSITSYGAAPALQIGSTDTDIAIGAVAGTDGYGLVNKGSITGAGVYLTSDGTALRIGGLGGSVSIAGGILNSGTISGSTVSGTATGILIGGGASVPAIVNSGTISASGSGSAIIAARAIVVETGGTLTSITNSGVISATATGTGTATAILDQSGTLTTIANSRTISATTAIDLSANSSGVTIDQYFSDANSNTLAPAIAGAILTGSGDDSVTASDGTITGTINLGAGNDSLALSGDTVLKGDVYLGDGNDRIDLSGTSSWTGALYAGGGANALTIGGGASYAGAIDSGAGLSIDVAQGSLLPTNSGTIALTQLNVGAASTIGVNIDPKAGTNTLYAVAGTASLASGTTVRVSVSSLVADTQRFTVLTAGSLVGGQALTTTIAGVPFLYTTTLTADADANSLTVELRRKSASELGLSRGRATAYDAIYAALGTDASMAAAFTTATTQSSFSHLYGQMMPIEAGGIFEAVTQGSRAFARHLSDDDGGMSIEVGSGHVWLQEIAFRTQKPADDNEGYTALGWGFGGGIDQRLGGLGLFGLSLNYVANEVKIANNKNSLYAGQFELGGYWRGEWKGFEANARGAAALISLNSKRYFHGTTASAEVDRTSRDTWSAMLLSAGGGVAYTARIGRLSLKPSASVEYYRLNEKAHDESGGGTAFDLSIDRRRSDEFAANGLVTVGYALSDGGLDDGWARVELEGGRRHIIGGTLGDTIATYSGGSSFRLTAEDRSSGYLARVKLSGGNQDFRLGGEFGAEQQEGRTALALRAALRVGL